MVLVEWRRDIELLESLIIAEAIVFRAVSVSSLQGYINSNTLVLRVRAARTVSAALPDNIRQFPSTGIRSFPC